MPGIRSLIRRPFRLLRVLCLALVLPPVGAVATTGVPAQESGHVVMQIVLIRHGIRAPTKSPAALAPYATRPWPSWPVAPGQLTPHGARLMRSLGAWYRRDLATAGLRFAACPGAADFKVVADSTPRNRASAAAMLEGFAPGCANAYAAFAPGHVDPLFHGVHNVDKHAPRAPALPLAAMNELQDVLLDCRGAACIERAHDAGRKVLLDEKPAKALKRAGSLAENLMLGYAEGMPMAQVGWGRLDAAGIERLIALHNAEFAAYHKAVDAARARGGNMLAHVAAALAAAAGMRPELASLAPRGTRALFLVGHDTDLASQAGLLGLDWHNGAQPDDYPPGSALIYQLVEVHGRYAVRLRIAQPTLAALRAADVASAPAMHVASLRLPGCDDAAACPLARFQTLVRQAVPFEDIVADSGGEPAAH